MNQKRLNQIKKEWMQFTHLESVAKDMVKAKKDMQKKINKIKKEVGQTMGDILVNVEKAKKGKRVVIKPLGVSINLKEAIKVVKKSNMIKKDVKKMVKKFNIEMQRELDKVEKSFDKIVKKGFQNRKDIEKKVSNIKKEVFNLAGIKVVPTKAKRTSSRKKATSRRASAKGTRKKVSKRKRTARTGTASRTTRAR